MRKSVASLTVLAVAFLAYGAHAGPSGYKVTARIAGPDGGWDYAAVDPVKGRLFVAHGARVSAVDLKSRVLTADFAPATGSHQALPINGGAEVLITNGQTNTVTIVDAATGSTLATMDAGKNPDAATFDPASGLVLVMNHSGGDITLIDPKTRKAVGSIQIGGTLEAAIADGAGKAFVNVEDTGEVVAIDTKARKVVARYAVQGCKSPTGIAYDAADKLVMSACAGVTAVLHAADGSPAAMVKTGAGADGIAYDPKAKLAFVSAGGSGVLSVISLAGGKPTWIEDVPTQAGARTLALDPRDGAIYLPTAKFDPPATPGARGAMQPGSFEILVVRK